MCHSVEIKSQWLGVSSSSFLPSCWGLLLFLSLFTFNTSWLVSFCIILLSLRRISHRSAGITDLSFCIQLSVGLRVCNQVGKLVQLAFFFLLSYLIRLKITILKDKSTQGKYIITWRKLEWWSWSWPCTNHFLSLALLFSFLKYRGLTELSLGFFFSSTVIWCILAWEQQSTLKVYNAFVLDTSSFLIVYLKCQYYKSFWSYN